ncbi:MAG: four helix bundle protein [Planctomycetales bacterium]|nr:four helix bundle protein [Planctomycetales bacterium]
MRRAVISIASNIAEGAGRDTQADFARFLDMAMGSACELHCQVLLARDLDYVQQEHAAGVIENIVEVKRMLGGLVRKIRPRN